MLAAWGADDYMVDEADFEDFGSLFESAGELDVSAAGGGIAGRVVVD